MGESVELYSVGMRYMNEKFDDVELIETTSEKIKIIRERLKTAQNRQKSYADS